MFFETDDIQQTWDDLEAKGVELPEEPTARNDGTDFGLRDPFGNHVRIAQPPA
ncbi:MAG: VOC family protein [Janthinobacterium lividum]